VAAQQVELQRREIVPVDPSLGKIAEAGVDAVDRFVSGGLAIDDGAGGGDAGSGIGCEADLGAIVGDRQQVCEREIRSA
jgi:hypothetical protein